MTTILLIDPDRPVANSLAEHLQQWHEVRRAETADEAQAALATDDVDLVIAELGLNLSELVGPYRGLIVLTPRQFHVQALNLGADDAMAKPVSLHELTARIEAVLRRIPKRPQAARPNLIHAGALTIDTETSTVTADGQELSLSPTEYRLMRLLASQPGQVVPRRRIAADVWGCPEDTQSMAHVIYVSMQRLRSKLPRDLVRIESRRGYGYRLHS